MWLTSLSIRRPIVILMAVLAIMLGGVIAYGSLGVDLLPRTKFPYVSVSVAYPGAGPREVEARVTKPIENAVAGATGIKSLFSTSGDGYSTVLLEFKDNTDPDAATQDVERRINQVRSSLPEDALDPTIAKYDPSSQPIVVSGASWDRNPDGLFQLADETIRPRLEAVEGVASVRILGGREREIHVTVDRQRLEARGLSLAQVTNSLAAANLSVPGGYVRDAGSEYSLRVYGLYQQLDQMGNLVLAAAPSGGLVRLKDVASVEDSSKRQTYLSRVNGREGVGILVQKQQTANTVAVSEGVQRVFKELRATLPPGVEIATVLDSAQFVRESLSSLQHNLRDAALITALVLLLFLHTWRSTLIVLVSIPTSLIATFGVMWVMGFTINMMTMMGLALSIGILVDDSIVVLENIFRHMKLGDDRVAAALSGRAEIGAAAVAITLVDVVVYTPVGFLTGMVGQFFKEFGFTIVVATLFSLLVSFTLTPMLASRALQVDAEERSPLAPLWRRWEAGYESLRRGYRSLLGHALDFRWLVLLLGVLAFFAGIAMVALKLVSTEFLTQSDQGQFSIAVEMPPGTPLEGTSEGVGRLEQELASIPEVDASLATVGLGGQYGLPQHRSARVYVQLKPVPQRSRSVFQVSEEVRALGTAIPGMKVRINLPSIVGYTGQPVVIRVRGTDMDTLTRLAGQVEEIVRRTPGTVDVSNSASVGAPEMRVEIDHQKLSDLGLTTAQVATAVRTAYEGTVATQLRRENEDKVDIRVLYAGGAGGTDLQTIPDIPLTTLRGAQVKLSQVARLVPVEGPAEIEREDRMRQIVIGSNLLDRPLGEISEEIRAGIRALSLPPDYRIIMEGDTQLQDEAFGSLLTALGISILLMYMLMAALYDSLIYPLVIMGSLPVASVGAIGALAITGDTLSMTSLVGIIMLTGLVAKNAILLVDYTNTLRKRGYPRREALLEAGPTRLRPIVMTTAAMVFAMLPMAMKMGEGAATRAPMAIVVIGGLIASSLLTLVVVPAAYTVMDDFQGLLRSTLARRTPVPLEAIGQEKPGPFGTTPPRHEDTKLATE